jgi:Fe(3+) dicitrate transport protein
MPARSIACRTASASGAFGLSLLLGFSLLPASLLVHAESAASKTTTETISNPDSLQDTAVAPAADDPTSGHTHFERMTVLGSRENSRLIAGAANFVSPEEITRFKHSDVMRVLRQVPGVYVVEEEGLGLRPNIGIRGSGLDRNARITVMEDGVLIAPAPYAAPAAYYFPTMQRMSAVEIRKGSASVRSGPRTTGGAINLVSTAIPDAPLGGYANLMFGADQTLLGHGHIGGSNENWGFLLEGVRQESDGFKRVDGGADAGYQLDDYRTRVRYNTDRGTGPYQEFELKLGRTDQASDETYMGLTDDDFKRNPDRRYAASALDNIDAEHRQTELRHFIEIGPTLDVTTAVYRSDFKRNWYKVEQVNGRSLTSILNDPGAFATEYGWLTGLTSPDNAILLRNNNREYESRGVQSIIAWAPSATGAISHSVEFGIRHHQDEEDRFQDNDRYRMQDGTLVLTTDGAPGSQDNRVGSASATALYLQNVMRSGDWVVTPGVRYERIELTQKRWALSDPEREQGLTRRNRNTVTQAIPGIGAVYLINDNWSALAGVHKGFNPPTPGSTSDAEESVNYEAGVRYASDLLTAELIGFFNDYSNLVGTCTESSGGNCDIGAQFDGGKVRMHGLELAAARELRLSDRLGMPLRVSYTYTSAEFRNSFVSGFSEWGNVNKGDELPYLPPHQLQLGTGLAGARWDLSLSAVYVDAMRVVAGQGSVPANERTDEHWVVDIAGSYSATANLSLFARLENAFDETYVAARRPAGLRPGRPRTGLVGLVVKF